MPFVIFSFHLKPLLKCSSLPGRGHAAAERRFASIALSPNHLLGVDLLIDRGDAVRGESSNHHHHHHHQIQLDNHQGEALLIIKIIFIIVMIILFRVRCTWRHQEALPEVEPLLLSEISACPSTLRWIKIRHHHHGSCSSSSYSSLAVPAPSRLQHINKNSHWLRTSKLC